MFTYAMGLVGKGCGMTDAIKYCLVTKKAMETTNKGRENNQAKAHVVLSIVTIGL
jgi:hypothetical protein